MSDKIVVGAEEWVGIRDLKIPFINARIDSGAKTSSLHAVNIKSLLRNGETWVEFDVFPIQNDGKRKVKCTARVIDRRVVKSSSGTREQRFVIRTPLTIQNQTWDIEVTLTNRHAMGYRMLLGREAMSGRLIVDPAQQFALGKLSEEQIDEHYRKPNKAKSGLRIGLLASNPNLYSNRRLIEAAEQLGHQIEFYNIRQCFMKLDADRPEVRYRGGKSITHLDAIIPRVRPTQTFYACALIRLFESMGVFCLNNSDAIIKSRDKLFSLQLADQLIKTFKLY